ncbi:MAG TPA: hypothetical protein VHN77_07030 [Phycisphaerales bacterium]|nr:hypothetical protein [Phycisphaerales bacterium]
MNTGIITLAVCLIAGAASAQTFQGLGVLPGRTASQAVDMSTDGTTVAGNSNVQDGVGVRAWRWHATTGLVDLGIENSTATRINDSGDAIVGGAFGFPTLIWRSGQPAQSVPLPGSNLQPGPGVSGDGVTVIGNWSTNGYRASSWTQAGGVVPLPYAPSTPTVLVTNNGNSVSFVVNQDGSVIGGSQAFRYSTDPIITERFAVSRWTASGSELILNALGQPVEGGVYDMSSDGNTLLVLAHESPNVFYRWTPAGGYQLASGLQSFLNSAVARISGDGSTIISYDKMWTQSRGALPITQVLTESGATFTGWTNLVATGIDFNATHLCGYGTNPMGQTEAWYATIPAPGAGAVCAILTLAASRRCR